MPSDAAMRAAKAIGEECLWHMKPEYVLQMAEIIDREMGNEDEQGLELIKKLAMDRHYSAGFLNDLCTRCGHMERFHATDKSCPDHNWSVTCCGGIQRS